MFVALIENAYRSCCHPFTALTRASDTSVADGLYQTPVKNYNFSQVVIRFFLVVKIAIEHSNLYDKNGLFFFSFFNKCACVNAINLCQYAPASTVRSRPRLRYFGSEPSHHGSFQSACATVQSARYHDNNCVASNRLLHKWRQVDKTCSHLSHCLGCEMYRLHQDVTSCYELK